MTNVVPIKPDVERFEGLFAEVIALYRSGGQAKGASTGWPGLDEFYTVGMGQWTAITGTPGSGKSEFVDALAMNLAETDAWDFALYSPENYPTSTHMIKLIEKRVRKPFGNGPSERMTEREARDAVLWVSERFFWLTPDMKRPEDLIELAIARARPDKHLGVILDPWNTLEHQRGGMTETDYCCFILTEVTKLARSTNAHIWLVVHPAKIQRNKDGTRPVPTPYDISGSAHWYNKADNVITVHRDQVQQGQDVEVHVQKVRFKHLGHVGLATLKWDKVTGRYFEHDGPLIMNLHTGKPELYGDPQSGMSPPVVDAEAIAERLALQTEGV